MRWVSADRNAGGESFQETALLKKTIAEIQALYA